jgi:glycosyltransferase involved in cell wall biosynthesis
MLTVHDHTNGIVGPGDTNSGVAYLSTHHLTGQPRYPGNCVYLSAAHRRNAGASERAAVIPIPVNVSRYEVAQDKGDFLLFLGRVSAHKGTLEAAAFARASGLPLLIAGPSWVPEYRAQVEATGGASVKFLGEVSGRQRLDLLARARAVLVLSQPKAGPWGGTWCEPGATVVSEAAASGTPVIAIFNGCLPEIVPHVGHLVPFGTTFDPADARELLKAGPEQTVLRSEADIRWGHVRIASQYQDLYHAVISGACWQ